MINHSSIFSQLLKLFPRYEFVKLVKQHRTDFRSKGFRSWEQFVSMLFCQLAQAKSLREICDGLKCCLGKLVHLGISKAPNKSTLSYANEHRHWYLYRDLFYETLNKARKYAPGKKFRFKNKLLSLDATVIDLCLSIFPWAEFRRTKGAIKLHMLLDHDGYLPTYVHITEGKVHEVKIAHLLDFTPESIIAIDKGFNDYQLYSKWTEKKIWFVTRMKSNAKYKVIDKRKPVLHRGIYSDEIIRFSGIISNKKCSHLLRRIVVWDKETEREIILLTNHLNFGATTIAAIYKDRWQIELFFKALKQNLKIKTFIGTSKNAIQIQIWTALIAMVLIKLLRFRAKRDWSISNLVALIRWNLFTYRDLWEWINNPFETLPDNVRLIQTPLPFPGFGQQGGK